MTSAPSAGLMFGRTILKNRLISPTPSILPASKSAVGKFSIFWRIRKIPKALASIGRITAQWLSVISISIIISNNGTYITSDGIIMEPMTNAKIMPLPLKSNLASA